MTFLSFVRKRKVIIDICRQYYRDFKKMRCNASPKKCELSKDEIDVLGMPIGESSMKLNSNKEKIISVWARPSRIMDIFSFLGLLQIFRCFIPEFAKVATPLTDLTKEGSSVHK